MRHERVFQSFGSSAQSFAKYLGSSFECSNGCFEFAIVAGKSLPCCVQEREAGRGFVLTVKGFMVKTHLVAFKENIEAVVTLG
ncbi:hypothetical protein A9R05_42465 (plasmid) [Burkholderia sp. KK1]|nr:hypothetical protein A9R05_42465 [Burkholderia sp. KK1]